MILIAILVTASTLLRELHLCSNPQQQTMNGK